MIHRIGMLIPATNAAVETELNRILPRNYQIHVGRLRCGSVDERGWREQDADVDYQAQLLGTLHPAVVILLQTSASFFALDYDAAVTARIASHANVPAVTTAQAMGRALRALGARRVAMVSPYSDAVCAQGRTWFETFHDLEVSTVENFNVADPRAIDALGPDAASAAFARAAGKDVDAMIMAGGAFHALEYVQAWERQFGKTVVTTNQVAIWAAVQATGGAETIQGYGRLLSRMPRG